MHKLTQGSPTVVSAPDHPSAAALPLTIQQVAALLHVPAPTIRSWERRYGVPAVDRSRGGHRRYTPDQLGAVRLLRDLIAGGRRPGEAARLVHASASPAQLIDTYVQAAQALSSDDIQATLGSAQQTLGLERTIDDVLLPALREIGEKWRADRIDISHEHLAAHATAAWLASLTPSAALGSLLDPAPRQRRGPPEDTAPRRPPVLLCCGPDDQHTLGLEALAALLRQRQVDCRVLGARTPARSLTTALIHTGAVAVVLVCHHVPARPAAVHALNSAHSRARHLFFAGAAFDPPRARRELPGQYLGTNLARAADQIAEAIAAPTPA